MKQGSQVGNSQILFRITGPFIDNVFIGLTDQCAGDHVKALNLAYFAGRRNPLP